jgi:hypothetical protein
LKNDNNIKHKNRVANHGEVFTSKREVEAMLDLVDQETVRIDSRFLEPACGDGNFLAKILERKLAVVAKQYQKNQIEFERYALIAASSIYGIDILEDNVDECRQRLLLIFSQVYCSIYKNQVSQVYLENIKFVFSKNILWGDALSLKKVDNNQPITFCEWSAVNGSMIKRKDYQFSDLLAYKDFDEPSLFSVGLFSDLGEEVLIAKAKKEYPLTHFMELNKYD